ncbi:MAG: calcium/sodium antiporter [Bacteroidales bacterium]|nr:calcium/sodium antiporter [Bacteroidales bacterium]
MLFTIIIFILGFIILIGGANFLIKGASLLGKKFNISPMVIGIVVVGFGTSLPELIISVMAVIKGSADISISNAVGSNIANIMLILGILALITTISTVSRHTLTVKIPAVIAASIILFLFTFDSWIRGADTNTLGRGAGIIFLLIFVAFLIYTLFIHKEKIDENLNIQVKQKTFVIFSLIIAGIVGVVIGGNWVVDNAIVIARYLGISEGVIGVSILAIGSSLPEVVSSVTAALKKEDGLAMGNIIGSNLFNTFLILGIASVIKPLNVSGEQQFNILINIIASILFLIFVLSGKKGKVSKIQGVILLSLYVGFLVLCATADTSQIFGIVPFFN